jgi:hypothetical protein
MWKCRVEHTYKLLLDTPSVYPERFKVTRGPVTSTSRPGVTRIRVPG